VRFSADPATLAYYLQARPLTSRIPFKGMPCSALGNKAKEFLSSDHKALPETEAIWFYLGNHALAALRRKKALNAPLTELELEMVEEVFKRSNRIFLRMLYYVTVICVREARHAHDQVDGLAKKGKAEGLPAAAFTFAKSIHDDSSVAMQQFIDHAPADLTMGDLSRTLCLIFYKGKWGGGYGGPKWGNVSDTLKHLVHGEFTPEMFCDVGFALAHNGGPIYNKGIILRRRAGGCA
jgi:hypothetical protein